MNIPELCIRRPVMTTLVMAAIVLFGVIAYRSLPIAELPNVDFPTIEVSANLPGANPETMAASVATPLENQFSRIAGVKAMTSVSSLGSSRVTLEFDLNRNIDEAALDVQSAISATLRSLPADMPEPPSFRKINPADFAIFFLQLSSTTVPISTLSDYAETVLQQRVSTIEGVAQVQFWGRQRYAVRIQVNPDKLVARGIGYDEVERAIRQANSNLPTGTFSGTSKETSIKTTGGLQSARAYNDVVIAYRNGAPVRVKDIGRAIDSVDNDKAGTFFGDEQGMVMAIYRQPGSNTVKIVDEIKKVLPQLRLQIPAGITLDVLYDRSIGIRDSIDEVEFTLLLAAALVVMVIFIFLRNLTATLIASIALPISVIGTFAAMYMLGFSAQQPVADGADARRRLRRRRCHRHAREHRAPPREGRQPHGGRRRRIARDRVHHRLDDHLADRRLHSDHLHGRHARSPAERVRDHHRRRHPRLGYRLADADADAVLAHAEGRGPRRAWPHLPRGRGDVRRHAGVLPRHARLVPASPFPGFPVVPRHHLAHRPSLHRDPEGLPARRGHRALAGTHRGWPGRLL